MRGLLADCRHAVRLYVRTPGASLVAIAVLVIAMAFVGAFLSLYVDLVLRLHPGYQPGQRLVTVIQSDGVAYGGIPLAMIERINEEMPQLGGLAGLGGAPVGVSVGPEREPARIVQVTREWFPSLRPIMALGRGFEYEDYLPDAEPAIIISTAYWQQHFGSDPGVIGRTLELNIAAPSSPFAAPAASASSNEPVPFRIVGVITPALNGTSRGSVDLWSPFERFARLYEPNVERTLQNPTFWTFYRRDAGTTSAAVLRELNARYSAAGMELGLRPGFRLDGVEGLAFDIEAHRQARSQLKLFLAGSVLLALVAAANVSLFLLARAPGRRRELAIRMAVGAAFGRISRQLATESALLVVVAAALGLLASIWLNAWLRSLALMQGVEWQRVVLLDWRVLGMVGAVLLVLVLLVGLTPILDLKRAGIAAGSRQVSARATPVQRIAGTAQVAIACTLGGAAVAFAWYLAWAVFGDPGYTTRDLYLTRFFAPFDPQATPASALLAQDRRRDTLLTVPGISDVSFGTLFPEPNARPDIFMLQSPVNSAEVLEIGSALVDARFVDLLGLDLIAGRAPRAGEPNVALVNRRLARQIFGRDDVAGESLALSATIGPAGSEPLTTIVGVLEDVSFRHPLGDIRPMAFRSGNGISNGLLLIQSSLGTAALQQSLQGLIDSGALEIRIDQAVPLRALLGETMAGDRVRGLLTMTAAGLVVLLAGFGFYGTQRYLVAAGRREYAIRASLGAGPRALGRLVLARGLLLGLPGLVAGALLAFIAVAWLRDDFISRAVPPAAVTLIVVGGLALLVLAACAGPARQARATQPAPLLRED